MHLLTSDAKKAVVVRQITIIKEGILARRDGDVVRVLACHQLM